MMRNKTYHEMYDLLTQSMSLNHKMIDKIEELRTENAVLYKQIEECRDTLRTLILKDFESLMIIRDFFILLESKNAIQNLCLLWKSQRVER